MIGAANQQIVWALLSSAEFRFNHSETPIMRALCVAVLVVVSLVSLAASLILPIADSDYYVGFVHLGYSLDHLLNLEDFSFSLLKLEDVALSLLGVSMYLILPLSCLAAFRNRLLATVLAVLSFAPPAYVLAKAGIMVGIGRHEKAVAGGMICLLVASTSMSIAWLVASMGAKSDASKK